MKQNNLYIKNLVYPMKTHLLKNDAFCVAPWLSLYIDPDGTVAPCCTSKAFNIGNVNQNSLEYILRSEKIKNVKQNMLDGKKHIACNFCYNQEKINQSSLRKGFNNTYLKKHIDIIPNNEFKLKYLDIRFSNKCNFKCVMCGPELSSRIGNVTINLPKQATEWIYSNLKEIEQVYIAGGEPLIMQEHYNFLDKLLLLNKTDIKLRYNTNLSALKYKSYNPLEYWIKFKNIQIDASIDLSHSKGELIRFGLSWKQFQKNWYKMQEFEILHNNIHKKRHSIIRPQITITAITIFYLPEFLEIIWNDLKYKEKRIATNFCMIPERFNPCILPDELKQKIKEKFNVYKEKFKTKKHFIKILDDCHNSLYDNSQKNTSWHFKNLMSYMNKKQNNFGELFPIFKNYI